MSEITVDWAQTVVYLLASADRLEGHGQYNLAKLARAAAESLTRRAAYALVMPRDPDDVVSGLGHLAPALTGFGLDERLAQAMERGLSFMADGQLPLIEDTPAPYVCRTCGELTMSPPDSQCAVCGAWPGTFKRYQPVYWLDEFRPRDVVAMLKTTPDIVASFLAGLDEEKLSQPAADGGWSMRQVVTHLRDAEQVLRARLGLMTKHNHPTLESLAVFDWADSDENQPPTTAELYAIYRRSRKETLAILEGLPGEDWWRTGYHKEFGVVTILQQASYFAAHELTHLSSLARLRG